MPSVEQNVHRQTDEMNVCKYRGSRRGCVSTAQKFCDKAVQYCMLREVVNSTGVSRNKCKAISMNFTTEGERVSRGV